MEIMHLTAFAARSRRDIARGAGTFETSSAEMNNAMFALLLVIIGSFNALSLAPASQWLMFARGRVEASPDVLRRSRHEFPRVTGRNANFVPACTFLWDCRQNFVTSLVDAQPENMKDLKKERTVFVHVLDYLRFCATSVQYNKLLMRVKLLVGA